MLSILAVIKVANNLNSTMKIVVLDGFTMNPGDLSWQPIHDLGNLTVFNRTAPDQVLERAQNADIILTNKVVINDSHLKKLPALKLIVVTATGYNNVDIDMANLLGVTVCNATNYSTTAVAQHTFALILELTNHCGIYSTSVHQNQWFEIHEWTYNLKSLMELSGKTLGIIGYGNIGKNVSKIALAFDMNVLVYHKHPIKENHGIMATNLEDLIEKSDVISLHCPLNNENKEFINKSRLEKMKPSCLLINTSRGPLINENDLLDALVNNRIAGAGLDVLSLEPPVDHHPLTKIENCIITPHRAWAAKESRERLLNIVVKNIQAFLKGKPENVIS